jgi:hypothetical protein
MKEFKASRYFVARVMEDVRAYETSKNPYASWSQMFLSTRFARYALSVVGGLLGIINLIRIYLTLFSPVACR